MSPVVSIELEWKYTPLNFFEEPINITLEGIILTIENGKAFAQITIDQLNENSDIKSNLHRIVESKFQAIQMFNHKKFELSQPSRIDIKENGGKNYYLHCEPAVYKTTMGSVDFVVKDKYGNIKSDTKKDRIEKQDRILSLISKHIELDSTLSGLISSYNMSVKDPYNELVHLYEIRDALLARFGSKKTAMKSLNITNSQWNDIGFIANELPLKQGRHRGKMLGKLREADSSELEKSRKSAVDLIEKYLEYIEE